MTIEKINELIAEALNVDLVYFGKEDKEAEKELAYLAGVVDMANAVKIELRKEAAENEGEKTKSS